jgi:uncharacterized protein YoxC
MTKKLETQNEINRVADAIYDLAKSVRLLGNGNVDREDQHGAIADLAVIIRESNKEISSALHGVASSLQSIADAIASSSSFASKE